MRSRSAGQNRYALAVLLAGVAAAGLPCVFFPSADAAPLPGRLGVGVATAPVRLLGQGQGGSPASAAPTPFTSLPATAPPSPSGPGPAASPSASAVSPAPVADAFGLGLYDGEFGPVGIETAAEWLGSPSSIRYAEDFIDATDFSHISDPWQLPNWEGSPFTMVWGVPMVPCGAPSTQCATDVSDFNAVADGGADGYYKTLAQNLVSSGFGSSYIRLGWEFNGSWMGWSICNQQGSGLAGWASDFVSAYQHIVTSMRSDSGANFKFIWNPIDSSNASCPGANLENFYPGDSYVDTVALDVYDGIGQETSSDAVRWADLRNGVNAGDWTAVTPAAISGQEFEGYGLDWLAAFGKEHNKQVGIPEWGLDASSLDAGGGDDAYFMAQMAAWIKANATGPAIFWNYDGGTLPLDIPDYTTGATPDATTVFRVMFGWRPSFARAFRSLFNRVIPWAGPDPAP